MAQLTCTVVVLAVYAAAEPVPPARRPFLPDREPVASAPALSTSRRFVVSGMSLAENVALSAAADRVLEEVEARTGLFIPFARHEVIRIAAVTNRTAGRARMGRAQGWADRQIVQRLVLTEPGAMDQEDLLEALCWLLLNRLVIMEQPVETREERPGEVPDWLAVGLAQNLYASLRSRNAGIMVDAWRGGGGISFEEVLELDYLPDGRWGEKAAAGLAVDWLLSRPGAAAMLSQAFEHLAADRRLDMLFFSRPDVLGLSPREIEKRWDLWIAQQSKVKREWGGVSREKVNELERLLVARPRGMGFVESEDMPSELPVSEMLEYREADWLPGVATALSLKIKGLGIGESERFRAVLDAYGEYLEALSLHARGSGFQRFLGRVPSELEVKGLLVRARARHDTFREESGGDAVVSDGQEPEFLRGEFAPMRRFMTREERLRRPAR